MSRRTHKSLFILPACGLLEILVPILMASQGRNQVSHVHVCLEGGKK